MNTQIKENVPDCATNTDENIAKILHSHNTSTAGKNQQ